MTYRQQLLERLAVGERIIRETPIIELQDSYLMLHTKLEFLNGIGSIKDRPAFWILKRGIERGEIGPDTTIIESSSGNFACALASFCRILKLQFIPVLDPVVPPAYEAYLRSMCGRVVKVDECDETGGYLKTRLRMVQTLKAEISECFWTNQYENPDGMDAHYRLTGQEILRNLPKVEYVFLGVSSAGTISGVSRALKEHNPDVRIIAVDAEGSVIFGQKPKKRYISGIGSSITPPLLRQALIDDIAIVSERDTLSACHELLMRHRLFVGGSTGTVYSAIQSYFNGKKLKRPPVVLFLCCDRGTAYLHNVYNPEWAAVHFKETAMAAPTSVAS